MSEPTRILRDTSIAAALGVAQVLTASADVVVNELLGSTSGSDSEFIELYNSGTSAVDISDWSVTLYESDNAVAGVPGSTDGGSPYLVPAGISLEQGEYFLFANSLAEASFGVIADEPLQSNAIENSSYTVVLKDAGGVIQQTIFVTDGGADDAANDGVQLITPDFSFGPDGRFLPAGFILNIDTGEPPELQDFSNFTGTGSPQGLSEPPVLPPIDPVTIMDIQGAGHTSPLLGEEVLTQGVVTAVDSSTFYLQDVEGDGDIATSDALVVFGGGRPSVGDLVEVRGTVSEFTPGGVATRNLSTTQISSVSVLNIIGTAYLPDPVILGEAGRIPPNKNIDDDAFAAFEPETDGIDFFESVEAMRVTVPDALAIAGTNRFGEIFTVGDGGKNATGISKRGTLNIAPDDFNPEKIQVDEDSGIFNFDFPQVDVGATLGDVTGVVGYGFGNFEVYPTEEPAAAAGNIEPESTKLRPKRKRLSVATYNVLNLDPNDGDGDTDIANGRFDAIAAHIVDNLNTPDIIGLQEIQDNDGSDDTGNTSADLTLQLLVDAVVAAGGPEYAFRDTPGLVANSVGGQPGGNIRVAFLFNPERVSIVGDVETLTDPVDQSTNPANPFFGSRISLAGVFEFNGEEVTVVNNHLSSKGGSAPILGVEQPFDQRQEDVTVNGSLDERQRQATAVADYVAAILNANRRANVVVLGDLNEFEFVSPVKDILGAQLSNTTDRIRKKERYTFIFQGNSQSLDHVLLSESLRKGFKVDIVHVNTEFAESNQRASDHDPIIVSLKIKGDDDDDDDEDEEDDD